jgi:hypothetical protein
VPAVSIDVLEVQRARKVLQAFCARRNQSRSASQAHLLCSAEGSVIEMLEIGGVDRQGRSADGYALLRLCYERGLWRIYWRRGTGAWEPYPHLPETDSVSRVIDELEQAPLHVHWG